jgi:hypothetical protein
LRNDCSYEGGYGGRTAIMFIAFGPGDKCENAHQQRRTRDVHASIDIPYWWEWYGKYANDKIGVRLLATSFGTLIFSNVNRKLPTVISTKCIHRVCYEPDKNMTGCNIPGYGRM